MFEGTHDKAGGAARASAPVEGAAADMDDALQLFDETHLWKIFSSLPRYHP